MKRAIVIVLLVTTYLWAAEPFTLEPVVPKKHQVVADQETGDFVVLPIVDYLQIQRNFDKIQRKIREQEYREDSNFVQKGSITSGQFSWDAIGGYYESVVYLDAKYETSTDYRAYISRNAPNSFTAANQLVLIYSDSSFAVRSDTTGNGIYWLTIGIRKK